MDKIENDTIFNIYEEHSEAFRATKYGSEEFIEFKDEIMKPATDEHAKQRHHFYSDKSPMRLKDVNLFDVIEALIDWLAASARDCHTVQAKKERIDSILEKYFSHNRLLFSILSNTAYEIIERATNKPL